MIICLRKFALLTFAIFLAALSATRSAARESSAGIKFETDIGWSDVVKNAVKEHKFIFVDCYTTWCAPCKAMDENIFPNPDVGQFYNEHFISVRIQMDKTNRDSARVKAWYAVAERFANDYKVNAYPTLLFFSPEGKPVHRAAGGFSVTRFIALAKDAMDPTKQYYVLMDNYHPEVLSSTELKEKALALRYNGPELAGQMFSDYLKRLIQAELTSKATLEFAAAFPELDKAQAIVRDYLAPLTPADLHDRFNQSIVARFQGVLPEAVKLADSYINSLGDKDVQNREAMGFIINMMHSTNGPGFQYFYKHADDIDKSFETPGFAEGFLENIIIQEYIDPRLTAAGKPSGVKPDWDDILRTIKEKYSAWYANSCVSLSKWQSAKSHDAAFANEVLYFDVYGHENGREKRGAFELNEVAWFAFMHNLDPQELSVALAWSKRALTQNPYDANNLDTYANLLYKQGEKNKALYYEEIAGRLDPARPENKMILANLEKMKAGVPTWTVSEDTNPK